MWRTDSFRHRKPVRLAQLNPNGHSLGREPRHLMARVHGSCLGGVDNFLEWQSGVPMLWIRAARLMGIAQAVAHVQHISMELGLVATRAETRWGGPRIRRLLLYTPGIT